MGSIISNLALCISYLTCSAAGSLCGACLGTNKSDDIAPGPTSGRKRSVFLLLLALTLAFVFQYALAPAIDDNSDLINWVPVAGSHLVDAWNSGCTYDDIEDANIRSDYQEICKGHAGVYRIGFVASLFFAFAALASTVKRTANRISWGPKYMLFLLGCFFSIFIDNDPLFNDVFLNLARIGASLFIVLQNVILIDMAYNWNDAWVINANTAERENGDGAGNKWLAAILGLAVLMFIFSITSVGLMYHYYGGCDINEAFISITLIMIVAITGVQLSGEDGSLLTSAIISAYAAYLAFTSMSKNPDGDCNPFLGENNALGIVIGVGFTLISLTWAGFSLTAEKRLSSSGASITDSLLEHDNENDTTSAAQPTVVGGLVTGDANNDDPESQGVRVDSVPDADYSTHWKLNVVLMLVVCWFSVSLTGWGTVESSGNAANPDTGKVSMWMIIVSQWLTLGIYLW
eukprot:CAMPEP_0196809956 /NCGR_PEP_ID=MMETSP1362-20130617/9827_1 /TAXON_ID=163516 /ORGANISM="Leptocylindrus danicus, Strain CCMP1856" /LENGTH=459 /DNA_ID=CAMNT_0042184807 /DNA_START=75 /DNA_END=1451 /DNA_ORIENTATION=-